MYHRKQTMNEMNQTNAPKNSTKSLLIPVMLVTAGILFAFLLFKNQSNKAATTEQPAVTTTPEVLPDTNEAGGNTTPEAINEGVVPLVTEGNDNQARVITIEAGSFYYKPNLIQVKKGETVRIEMTAADMMHDFNIDELGVKMPITKTGNTGSVEFTADTVGEFEFYCSVGQHRANGQVGTLIVEN